ncbi:hypothetical protein [Desulfofundulus sp.]|uniref:hypothetical protein n=1 Tax=Desulfofundulus sp. TaxID=2282750 RepID=UPI003C764EBB
MIIARAWQAGNALVLACLSRSSPETFYPVLVRQVRDHLEVEHICPSRNECWHVREAARLYREWRWWEPVPERVVAVRRPVVLRPDWVEIPVPGTVPEEIEKVLSA